VTYGHYRKNKSAKFYCKKCAQEMRTNASISSWTKLSDEEIKKRKLNYIGKNNPIHKINERKKDEWKKKISKTKSKKALENLTEEQIKIFGDHWSNLNQRERDKFKFDIKCDICGKVFQITYGHYSRKKGKLWKCKECRYDHHSKLMREKDSFKNYRENESEELKKLRCNKMSMGISEYYKNLPEEKRQLKSDNQRENWANRSIDDFDIWAKAQSEGVAKSENKKGPTEIWFANELNKNHINYKWGYSNNIKHPEFNDKFPYNKFRDTIFISPYHAWDFIIYTNKGNILVDIDGGIHNPNDQIEDIKFNDSQRPYQTDGMDAYIIEAYDDFITNENKVLCLKDNEIITVKYLIDEILLMNMSKKEIKESLINIMKDS
jgi:predicted RNA-binding Zn-ribbon protein involved in translation (DUF1610 family)